jgi:hypothetical protein
MNLETKKKKFFSTLTKVRGEPQEHLLLAALRPLGACGRRHGLLLQVLQQGEAADKVGAGDSLLQRRSFHLLRMSLVHGLHRCHRYNTFSVRRWQWNE